IVFYGSPGELRLSVASLTGQYLGGRRTVAPVSRPPPEGASAAHGVVAVATSNRWLELRGVAEHNLKNLDVRIPLKRLVCVTGVSGSGKSTLVEDVLYPALLKYHGKPTEAPGEFADLSGAELIDDVVMVDQNPIGRTTRSNPASYVGAFDAIRALFAAEPAAQERKYGAGTFSFNSGNGRCPACNGNGFEHVEMQFLSDVYLRCPDCNGRRYRDEILEVKVESRSIADVLEMTVSEALSFFATNREVQRVLQPLAEVGLEYLKLGQPVPTLSGGERVATGPPAAVMACAASHTGKALRDYALALASPVGPQARTGVPVFRPVPNAPATPQHFQGSVPSARARESGRGKICVHNAR